MQLHLALLPGVVRRVHRLQNQLWPSLRLTREGSARHGVSRPGAPCLAKLHKANQLKSLDCRADPPQRSDIPTWHPAGRHILPIYFEYRPVWVWLKELYGVKARRYNNSALAGSLLLTLIFWNCSHSYEEERSSKELQSPTQAGFSRYFVTLTRLAIDCKTPFVLTY